MVTRTKCNNGLHPGPPEGGVHRLKPSISVYASAKFCREILVFSIEISYKFNKNRSVEEIT